jgi:hypothetical protein
MLRNPVAMLTLLVLLGTTSAALADDKEEKKSADLRVLAIRATTDNDTISPELKDIAEQLKKQFRYTGFKLEKTASGKADVGKTFKADLVGGYRIEITPKRHDGERVQMEVKVLKDKEKKPKLSATITIKVKKYQLFGGMSLTGGDALILAVSAR